MTMLGGLSLMPRLGTGTRTLSRVPYQPSRPSGGTTAASGGGGDLGIRGGRATGQTYKSYGAAAAQNMEALGLMASPVQQFESIETPEGTLVYKDGRWVYTESEAVKQARLEREALTSQYRTELTQTPEERGLQLDEFRDEFFNQAYDPAEIALTQSMLQRGMGGVPLGEALGEAAGTIGGQATLAKHDLKQSYDNAILNALAVIESGGSAATAAQQRTMGMGQASQLQQMQMEQARQLGLSSLYESQRQFDLGQMLARQQLAQEKELGLAGINAAKKSAKSNIWADILGGFTNVATFGLGNKLGWFD